MLNLRTLPVGMDFHIDKIQRLSFERLISVWPAGIRYESYPRCYRNKTADGYVAELYKGNNEYADLYWDDTVDALSFFGMHGEIKHGIGDTVQLHWVFFVNVEKLKPGAIFRADNEVRQDVEKIIGLALYAVTLDSTELWLENVLSEYPGTRREKLIAVDMHPIHCFRINLTLNYNPSINCNKKF